MGVRPATFLRVPVIRFIIVSEGLYWGTTFLGNYHIRVRHEWDRI